MELALYLDAKLFTTTPITMTDDQGVVQQPCCFPPLGVGIDWQPGRTHWDRGGLLLSADLSSWTGIWNFGIPVRATSYQLELDIAWKKYLRQDVRNPTIWEFIPYFEGGSGLRYSLLAQSGFRDILVWGVGAHAGIGVSIGKGHFRWMWEARGSVSLIPSYADGELDTAAANCTWHWTPSSARLSISTGIGRW
jgi:hypothetical protein